MTHLCVPIFVESVEQLKRDAALAGEAGADLLELRIDRLKESIELPQLSLPFIVTCRPTLRQAEDYWRHSIVDNADWRAVDNILAMKNVIQDKHAPTEFQRLRNHQANGMGGLPLIGDPDSVAQQLVQLAAAGLTGIAVSFVNYLDELPYFCAEILPRLARLGLREPH